MLESLTLVNFQKHTRLVLKLAPGVNVLRGESEAGKSSVVRALRWLCLNQPGGSTFIRNGSSLAEVVLEVNDHTVTRGKGKGANTYALDDADYTAFGTGVPADIASLLNVGDVNFQRQHEPLFWLTLTPGEAAKKLNEIVNLEDIDRATAEAASRARKAKEQLEYAKEQLDQAEKELQGMDWVQDAWLDYQKLEELGKRRDEISLEYADREYLLRRIEEAQEAAQDVAAVHESAAGWITLGEKLAGLELRRDQAWSLLDQITSKQKLVADIKSRLAKAEDAFSEDFKNCPVCGSRWKKPY